MQDTSGNKFNQIHSASIGQTVTLNCWSSSGSPSIDQVYFCIGDNNTEATADTYMLSSNYVKDTDYSMEYRTIGKPVMVNGKAQLTFTVTFTAINNITIGEVGLARDFKSTSTGTRFTCLFGRATLDTPIILTSGERATFQVTVEI